MNIQIVETTQTIVKKEKTAPRIVLPPEQLDGIISLLIQSGISADERLGSHNLADLHIYSANEQYEEDGVTKFREAYFCDIALKQPPQDPAPTSEIDPPQ